MKAKHQFVSILKLLKQQRPDEADPVQLIESGCVLVCGRAVTNSRTLVPRGSAVQIVKARPLRGSVKLRAALQRFGISVRSKTAADIGACTGGFTTVLLEEGATRVYAVDTGHGQLLGSLRLNPRVVNLEGTNLSQLGPELIREAVDLVTVDLSYLALSVAAPQLACIPHRSDAQLIALVKPMFELGLAEPTEDTALLENAVARASRGFEATGWQTLDRCRSPVLGSRGAIEFFIFARRRGT